MEHTGFGASSGARFPYISMFRHGSHALGVGKTHFKEHLMKPRKIAALGLALALAMPAFAANTPVMVGGAPTYASNDIIDNSGDATAITTTFGSP